MIDTDILNGIWETYNGSDGGATLKLYKRLEACGPVGFICMNLFRASKASHRAKLYRGGNSMGSFKGQAYLKKQWAICLLVDELKRHKLGLVWGWQEDGRAETFAKMRWVLYVETPFGQASFHGPAKGEGPHYDKPWDGQRGATHGRIIQWCAKVLTETEIKVA